MTECVIAKIIAEHKKSYKCNWLKGSKWFHDFWLAPPNKDIDKIGRPPM